MLYFLKTLAIGILSLTDNKDYIKKHNSLNLSYTLGENQFINREYKDEFYPSMNIITNNTKNIIDEEYLPEYSESVDWREKYKVSSVKNQKHCGGCWAFSSVGAVESAWAIKNNVLYNLSEQELIDCSVRNNGCNGGSMDVAFQYIINNSLCTNLSYPYEAMGESCDIDECDPVVNISTYYDVRSSNERALMMAVTQQPVSVAIQANKRSFQLYRSGIYNDPNCGYKLDHGVLIVGYGTDYNYDADYWLVKNSWGDQWGENGYIRLLRNTDDEKGQCGIAMMPSFPVV